MKAIILERKGEYAAALRSDGTVVRTRQAGEVGEEIELEAELVRFPVRSRRLMRTAVAAVAAVMLLGGSSVYVFAMPAEYVSLDAGESSVELALNRVGRVISVEPTKEDDRAMAETLSAAVRGKRVEDALLETMAAFREGGYLDGQDAVMIAGVTPASEKRGEELAEALENAATQHGDPIPLYTMGVTPAERSEARSREMSGGRYVFARGGGPEHEPPPAETMRPQESDAPPETSGPAESGVPVSPAPPSNDTTSVDGGAGPEQATAPGGEPAWTEPAARPLPPENEAGPGPAPAQSETPDDAPPAEPPATEKTPDAGSPAEPPATERTPDAGPPAEPPATEQTPDNAPPAQNSPQDSGADENSDPVGQPEGEQPPPAAGGAGAEGRGGPDASGEPAPDGDFTGEAPEETNGGAPSRHGAAPGERGQDAPGGRNGGPGR